MSGAALDVELGIDGDGRPVAWTGDAAPVGDMASLLRMAPGLASPDRAGALARAANHFASADYRVIEDPVAFETAYRARLARETPGAPMIAGVIRLSDFGVPDFGAITPPQFAGGVLRFFVEQRFLGLPYTAETADLAAPLRYVPMPLTPVADSTAR